MADEQPKVLTEEEKAARVLELKSELAALTPKPKTLGELTPDELHTAFMDELVQLLGSHPRLEAIWVELKKRISGEKEAKPAK